MPTTSRPSRTASASRNEVLGQLKEDHKRVKKAYAQFKKLDVDSDAEACQALVTQVLDELTVHAALEEEILYPAAREALSETDIVDEAEVEHESVHTFIEQLRRMTPADEKYAARFIVLCEYVTHHVKEEEGEMFPQLERAKLDWESISTEMSERRSEMIPIEASDQDDDTQDDADKAKAQRKGESDDASATRAGAKAPRPESKSASRGAARSPSARP
ncbi:MAG: hemerythrin domain-containing protein [Chitinophagaceae bacterium]|nr:hemerythrin domain-containing protein [Rubrivivax sp.]